MISCGALSFFTAGQEIENERNRGTGTGRLKATDATAIKNCFTASVMSSLVSITKPIIIRKNILLIKSFDAFL